MPDMELKKKQKVSTVVRYIVLTSVLVLSTALGIMHQVGTKWLPAGVDAFCPFGGVESAWALVANGAMIQRIAWSSFILFFATLIILVVFRRAFCGQFCALGFLQEIFSNIGKKIFKKQFQVPAVVDKFARYLKYVILIFITALSFKTGELIIREYDPWAAYHHLISEDLFAEFTIGFIILIVSMLGSVFYNRFFCKYLCPMGAFLGAINKIGLFKVSRNKSSCINCKACSKACPVNIQVDSLEKVQSSECIMCGKCVNSCPVKDTLDFQGPKSKKASPVTVTLATVLIMAVVVGATTVSGAFKWNIQQLSEAVDEHGGFNPDEIKGRNTFKEVSELSGIPKNEFLEKFKISEEQFNAPIKDSAHAEGSTFDTDAVRDFVIEKMKK